MQPHISYIELFHFRRHDHLRVDFTPGINVLIGQSRAGKSTVLLALLWVSTNRPQGDFHVPRGQPGVTTQVDVGFSDGTVVSRLRSKRGKVNEYRLRSADGKEEVYGTPGNGPAPEPIAALFNLSETNIQDQFSGIFLLSKTPKQISDYINGLVNLDAIDSVVGGLRSKLRTANSEQQSAETEIETAKKELEAYAGLPDVEGRLRKLGIQQQAATALEAKRQRAATILTVWAGGKKTLESTAPYIHLGDRIQGAQRLLDARQQTQTRGTAAAALLSTWKDVDGVRQRNEGVDALQDRLTVMRRHEENVMALRVRKATAERLSSLWQALALSRDISGDTAQFASRLAALQGTQSDTEKIQKQIALLLAFQHRWMQQKTRVVEREQELQALREQWEALRPDECPLCGSAEWPNEQKGRWA